MLYVGVLSDDGLFLVSIEGIGELDYTEEDIIDTLDEHFPEGVNNIDWRVLTKESEQGGTNLLNVKVLRVTANSAMGNEG